jgi:hypothetical protein
MINSRQHTQFDCTTPRIGVPLAPAFLTDYPMHTEQARPDDLDYKTPPPSPLNRQDLRYVRFWTKDDWEAWCNEGKEKGSFNMGVRGQGVNSSWMESADGTCVTLACQTQIIAGARRAWVSLTANGVPVTLFLGATIPTLIFFQRTLEEEFEELRYCVDYWKTRKLWSENVSSWRGPKRAPADNSIPSQPQLKKVSKDRHRPPTTLTVHSLNLHEGPCGSTYY